MGLIASLYAMFVVGKNTLDGPPFYLQGKSRGCLIIFMNSAGSYFRSSMLCHKWYLGSIEIPDRNFTDFDY
jgi:hypothetical protein